MANREPTEMELRVAAVLRGPGAACFMSEDDALETARAVIRAMRNETDEMNDAGADICDGDRCRCGFMGPIWKAMIDAASPGET